VEGDPNPMLADISPIVALVEAGASLEGTILPKIRAMAANGRGDSLRRKGRPWAYLASAISDDLTGDRERAKAAAAAGGNGQAPPAVDVDEKKWQTRLKYARHEQLWPRHEWGPGPHHEGCMVPPHLLEPTDGVGWREPDPNER
jgi:hypothetical protein